MLYDLTNHLKNHRPLTTEKQLIHTKVRPNKIHQDLKPHEYNQTVRAILAEPYFIDSHFSIKFL